MNGNKGISELVGGVILLVVAIAVASIYAVWAPDLAGSITQETGDQVESDIQCDSASMRVNSVTYYQSIPGDPRVDVEVENTGSQRFAEGVEVVAFNDGAIGNSSTIQFLDPGTTNEISVVVSSKPDAVRVSSRDCPQLSETVEDFQSY